MEEIAHKNAVTYHLIHTGSFNVNVMLQILHCQNSVRTMRMLPFVSFILHPLAHAARCSLSPSAFLLS